VRLKAANAESHPNSAFAPKLRDTETVMRSLEGGGWKSASNGNSMAIYPMARPDRTERGEALIASLDSNQLQLP
jgi:hypothetical protein